MVRYRTFQPSAVRRGPAVEGHEEAEGRVHDVQRGARGQAVGAEAAYDVAPNHPHERQADLS